MSPYLETTKAGHIPNQSELDQTRKKHEKDPPAILGNQTKPLRAVKILTRIRMQGCSEKIRKLREPIL